MHDKILILDFGSQVTQLIARRVRGGHVYCEIHPNGVGDAFVRVFAPGSAVGADPANVTTISARYNAGAATAAATDSTTVSDGLVPRWDDCCLFHPCTSAVSTSKS